MSQKCNKHTEQELVVIKYCPCCQEERIKNRPLSMLEVIGKAIPIQELPKKALPIYDKEIDIMINVDEED